jgi:hypothetical protein
VEPERIKIVGARGVTRRNNAKDVDQLGFFAAAM